MSPPEITEADYDFINSILSKYGNEDSILDCSELDGFLTAIVSGPEMIMPSTWMPAIWGGEANSPEWETKEEFERFAEIAIAMMNQTAVVLMEAPEEFEALFSECEVDDEVKTIVTNWCYGYMRVVDMHSRVWASMPEAVGANLGCIALFGSDETFDEFESLDDEEVEILQERIEPAVRALHAYWLEQRSQELPPGSFEGGEVIKPFVRATEKINRNDPCPCGSGKKYKKCCGAH